jgi:hypothetical protein
LIKKVYSWLVLPLVTGFFLVLMLSGFINDLRLTNDEAIFPATLNSLCLTFVWLVMGTAMWIEVTRCKDLSGEAGVKDWYLPFFMLKLVAIALLIQVDIFISLPILLYAVITVQFMSFVATLFLRPYK